MKMAGARQQGEVRERFPSTGDGGDTARTSNAGILIVEDDDAVRAYLERTTIDLGHRVVGVARSGEEALALARKERPALVLLDIGLEGPRDGVEVAQVLDSEFGTPFIFVSGRADTDTLHRASMVRPRGYIIKPVNREQLRAAIEVAMLAARLDAMERQRSEPPDLLFDAAPSVRPATRTGAPGTQFKIIGKNPRLREAIATVERVAYSNCNVLITGESGTGKELIVQALHEASPRRKAPLVAVNCGAIPDNLVESELFGHTRGAFTGAVASRQGLIAAAEGGTMFLDEVGDLPAQVQVKLLRLLQQYEYLPLGSSRAVVCDVRIAAATNRDLEAEVRAGRFREDLFYRLNVIHVELPPLRDRREDIPQLAEHFLGLAKIRSGRSDLSGFAPEVHVALSDYEWPGNIRSLENTIERAVLLSPGPLVRLEDLPPQLRGPSLRKIAAAKPRTDVFPDEPSTANIKLRKLVDEYENSLILQALERSSGNKNRAAQLLGINRTTLVEMMKRKGLS